MANFKNSRPIILIAIFIAYGLYFAPMQNWIVLHAPLSDDLSMIAFSKSWSWDWINKGLADYFIAYPEYYGAQSNFIRPVSNFTYWIFSAAFGTDYPFLANKIQLIILTYGMLTTVSILVGVILMQVQQSRFVALLGFLASLIVPTFWTTPSPTYTSFVFDGLAIAFCLSALWSFSQARIVTMTIFLALALMTKEIAFPVVLGFALSFLITRNIRAGIGCVAAIAVFMALRLNGFGLHAQGVYVFSGDATTFSNLIFEKLRNIFTLPFGPIFYEDIVTPTGLNLFNRSSALLLMNTAIYIVVLLQIVRARHKIKHMIRSPWYSPERVFDTRSIIILIASLSAMIAFLFDAYVGANYRYAFNFLPFLFIAFGGLDFSTATKRVLFLLFFGASAIASAPSLARLAKGSEFETYRYQIVRAFFDQIRAHSDSHRIIILNDSVLAYANPRAVEILTPTSSQIERGTSLYLDNCKIEDLSKIQTRIERSGIETRFSASLPECGRFAFESSPKLPEYVSGHIIRRNEDIHYEFSPDANKNYASVKGWSGRDLTIVTRNADLLYFDFQDQMWKFIAAGSQ